MFKYKTMLKVVLIGAKKIVIMFRGSTPACVLRPDNIFSLSAVYGEILKLFLNFRINYYNLMARVGGFERC